MASPTTRVDSSRDVRIDSRFAGVYRQSTLRPARLMTTWQPSISFAQSDIVLPSHASTRHGAGLGSRLKTTTSCPLRMESPGKNRPDLAAASWNYDFHTSINLSRCSTLGIMHCSYLPKMRYRSRARVSYPKFNSESGRIPKIPAQRHGTPRVSKTNKPARSPFDRRPLIPIRSSR